MRHLTTFVFILLAASLSVGLFWVKYQVQDLEDELARLDRGIETEHQSIRVLKAEWALLNDPARLRDLADKHLDLAPVSARQVTQIEELPILNASHGTDGEGER